MYLKRIQLRNYGPIESVDLQLPFDDSGHPKPVVLVGENGSGKTLLLSHIVNGLIQAKGEVYPESREVAQGKVYKLRSGLYIGGGRDYYFGMVEFEGDYSVSEIRTTQRKDHYSTPPSGIVGSPAEELWNKMKPSDHELYRSSLYRNNEVLQGAREAFANNCILFFPSDRYEEPAWLNEENLTSPARHIDPSLIMGTTNRTVIASSPLTANKNWVYDVIYDRAAFEVATRNIVATLQGTEQPAVLPIFGGYVGPASRVLDAVLTTLQIITRRDDAKFALGLRNRRMISIESSTDIIVPNLFQLSSGESSLFNLCMSILRDYDLSEATLSQLDEIRGIVVIDEVDLHLHSVHQYEVLPALLQLFPKVQFILTTHSPLVVLGMAQAFGQAGIALYRLPDATLITPEEFSEFGVAYAAFKDTVAFSDDLHTCIANALEPILFVEGVTDVRYIEQAATLLDRQDILERVDIRDAGGAGTVLKAWKQLQPPVTELMPIKILCLLDCDQKGDDAVDRGKAFRRKIPRQDDGPIKTGIENLFTMSTLIRAHEYDEMIFDIEPSRKKIVQGTQVVIPEAWMIHDDNMKRRLCDWICDNATRADFERFELIFNMLDDLIE